MAARFYGCDFEAEILAAEDRGWVDVLRGYDAISGEYASLTVTDAGRKAAGISSVNMPGWKVVWSRILRAL